MSSAPSRLEVAEVVGQGGKRRAQSIRRGSPFAASATSSSGGSFSPDSLTRPFVVGAPRSAAPAVGAALSCVLGLVSFAVGFGFSAGGLVTAAVGVGMGCWGLTSHRRGLATLGLVLCCLALTVSGFLAVVDLYTQIYGVSPFETGIPGDPL